MEKNRGNPLPCVVYNVLQQRAKEREKKELIAYQKRKAERNQELKEALKRLQHDYIFRNQLLAFRSKDLSVN